MKRKRNNIIIKKKKEKVEKVVNTSIPARNKCYGCSVFMGIEIDINCDTCRGKGLGCKDYL